MSKSIKDINNKLIVIKKRLIDLNSNNSHKKINTEIIDILYFIKTNRPYIVSQGIHKRNNVFINEIEIQGLNYFDHNNYNEYLEISILWDLFSEVYTLENKLFDISKNNLIVYSISLIKFVMSNNIETINFSKISTLDLENQTIKETISKYLQSISTLLIKEFNGVLLSETLKKEQTWKKILEISSNINEINKFINSIKN